MAEEKTRIHTRITSETERKIAAAMPLSNCQTQNEFVEKALQFYCDYVASQDCFSVLPPMLVAAIRATVQNSESHICRLLFKLAVEQAVMSNILAAVCEVDQQELERLRNQCIQQIRKTNGMISFDEALKWQKDV